MVTGDAVQSRNQYPEFEQDPVGQMRVVLDALHHEADAFERDYLLQLLKKNNGNISHAAREADIDRKYFRKLMRKYGIEGGPTADDDDE